MAISPAVQNPGTLAVTPAVPIVSALPGDLMRTFLYRLARNLYPDRPDKDPIPVLETWSWKYPYSFSREINRIFPSKDSEGIRVLRSSFWKQVEAIAVGIQPNPKSTYTKITVYVLHDYFSDVEGSIDHNAFSRFQVTKNISPDEQKYLLEYFKPQQQ